ncbi:MAG: hypothetical protein KBC84_02525 [Proteobacteria bacterium]|nr:hypothetical protein [Pseudomonadota bacterium]
MSEHAINFLSRTANDSIGDIFEPDVMLPSQLLSPDEDGLIGGERKLMAAILSDGIEAYIHAKLAKDSKHNKIKLEIIDWVEKEGDTYIFSFDCVSESLGINAEYLRLGLFRYVNSVKKYNNANPDSGLEFWKKIRRPRK